MTIKEIRSELLDLVSSKLISIARWYPLTLHPSFVSPVIWGLVEAEFYGPGGIDNPRNKQIWRWYFGQTKQSSRHFENDVINLWQAKTELLTDTDWPANQI